jgi:hypothetical protein
MDQQTVQDTPEVRVARGVALLDETVPDWRQRIDVETLDMTDGTQCVVGQVFAAAYWYGLGRLGLDEGSWDSHDYGFITEVAYEDYPDRMDVDATAALRDLWIQAINRE